MLRRKQLEERVRTYIRIRLRHGTQRSSHLLYSSQTRKHMSESCCTVSTDVDVHFNCFCWLAFYNLHNCRVHTIHIMCREELLNLILGKKLHIFKAIFNPILFQ